LPLLLDTSVAISIRDGDPDIRRRIAATQERLILSIVTVVELEGGIDKDDARRAGLDLLTRALEVRAFGASEARAYGSIVAACGYSRRKVLDRMIAAQALVLDIPLLTLNGADVREVPGLRLIEW
jgi:predicted nucleic acid-binding protein